MFGIKLYINSAILGIGLAMDAFSVSLANGLNETTMKKSKMLTIAATFAFFQALMPLIGWFCVHTIAQYFALFEKMIPWIALILLGFIGGKMLLEGIKGEEEGLDYCGLGWKALILQGIATSIDALSVGFTISNYTFLMALICALVIALVTFIICYAGVSIGKRFGTHLANRANILGGIILIAIGLEIFLTNVL